MMFWLVLEIKINYTVIKDLERFWFLFKNFLKIIFSHGEIVEFS